MNGRQSYDLDSFIKRRFTAAGTDVFDMFKWKLTDVIIKDHETGETVFERQGLEFPEYYSQGACDVIASKYFKKAGLGADGSEGEHSMRQPVRRMAGFWAAALVRAGLADEEQGRIFFDEAAYMMLSQMFAPNSPQWFGTGLTEAYGIDNGCAGSFCYNEKTGCVEPYCGESPVAQASACYILGVKDSLLGEKSLTDTMTSETRLFKTGAGVGSNWSAIRARGESLSGGGKSSGLLSFLKVFDCNAGAIKSGGVTRRAAKMNVLDIDHPEILDFIKWKSLEEDKAQALGYMGYSTAFGGEAYESVSGQNVNNTVRLTDSFMESQDKPGELTSLRGRTDNSVDSEIPSSELFGALVDAAWRCGDPGVQFTDTINAWHTCPGGSDGDLDARHNRINASNPCSEYLFLDDSACNLASLNILKFFDSDTGAFDAEAYIHAVTIAMLVLEASVFAGGFPTAEIAGNSHGFRAVGLGISNLAAALMSAGLPYGSEGAVTLSGILLSLMTGQAYYISSLMAKKTTPFRHFDINREHMLRVIRNHARAAGVFITDDIYSAEFEGLNYKPSVINHGELSAAGYELLSEALSGVWRSAVESGSEYGFRNAQVTCIAPTGTISLAMDCASTSIEPFFAHAAYKKMSDQSVMLQINPIIPIALKRLGYTEEAAAVINSYILEKGLEGAPGLKEAHYPVFASASCAGNIAVTPAEHVKMLGGLAPHISGGISKTVNLPASASKNDAADVIRLSWELGVKAVTIYRDGSKGAQPLNTASQHRQARTRMHEPLTRVKLKGIRHARVHEANIAGSIKLYITTSFYDDGRLGELYVSAGRQGSLIKGLLDSISAMISEMLQYGVNPEDIARMYRGQKFEPGGFVTGHPYIKYADSIPDLISKIIDIETGNYDYCQIKPAESQYEQVSHNYIYAHICPVCKSGSMIKTGVCLVCAECGSTTGCS